MVWEHDLLQQGSLAEKDPDREEGDGEEMADKYKGLLDQSGEKSNRTTDGTDLEVAETATLQGS